ncbi:MAG TPA: hypothetical protein VF857_02385 [Spirochaetota bacterium]
MKKIVLFSLCVLLAIPFAGCSSHKMSEAEYAVVWQNYLSRCFEESFDEKQSNAQKQKILAESVKRYGLDYPEFVRYLKKNHPDQYTSLF